MPPVLLYPQDIFATAPLDMLKTPAFGLDSFEQKENSSATGQQAATFEHIHAGQVHVKTQVFDSIKLTDIDWEPAVDFDLYDPTAFRGISSNFVLEGNLDSKIQGLGNSLLMRSKTHNFIHTPESGHINRLKAGQKVRMLIIDLDKAYFLSAVGQDDPWSEQVANNLETERPFAGRPGPAGITPPMSLMIDAIIHPSPPGPMRNLLVQSRILELLALQLESCKASDIVKDDVAQIDAQKLIELKSYLDSHCLKDHSLASLSRHCGLNEFKVKKGFKKLFNTTVFEHLRTRRMEYAGQLLRDQSLLIEEIALIVGYEHSQHFAFAFKKHTGLLPSQFKVQRSGHLSKPTMTVS